jgi:hypothetical protein
MAIGPTIENLRKKRAEEAALLEMLYALPTPTGGFDINTPAERRQLAERGLRGGEPYSEAGMDYGRQRPNRGTIQARTPSVTESLTDRATPLFEAMTGLSPRSSRKMASDVASLMDFMPVVGSGISLAQAGRDIGAGDYGSAAMNAGFSLMDMIPAVAAMRRGATAGARGAAAPARAAAETYMLRDRLAAPSGYVGPRGRPSVVDIPDAGRFDARPISEIENAAREYMDARGMDSSPLRGYAPVDPARAELIASAYDMMQHAPNDPMVRRAYDAMIQETMDQYNKLRDAGIEFKFLREGMSDPYARAPSLGYKDLIENGQLYVYPTDFGFGSNEAFDPSTNPLLKGVGRVGDKNDAVANDAFRAVHDAFGHFGSGNPFFRAAGEERAFQEHARMYSPEARGAMASETRGQNSWLNYGPYAVPNRTALGADTVFADQKTGLLPAWAYDVYGMPEEDELTRLLRNRENWAR